MRIIFVTSEAMRFGSHLKYFNYEKAKKSVEFKNIPEDIQNIINSTNDDIIQWKNYAKQLIGAWKAASKDSEQKRKEIFKKLSIEIDYWELMKKIFSDQNKFNEINWELNLNKEEVNYNSLLQLFISSRSKSINEIDDKLLWEIYNIPEL